MYQTNERARRRPADPRIIIVTDAPGLAGRTASRAGAYMRRGWPSHVHAVEADLQRRAAQIDLPAANIAFWLAIGVPTQVVAYAAAVWLWCFATTGRVVVSLSAIVLALLSMWVG